MLENKSNTEEDRVAIVEAQLAQAKLIAEEADRKYEEVKKKESSPVTNPPGAGIRSISPLNLIILTFYCTFHIVTLLPMCQKNQVYYQHI